MRVYRAPAKINLYLGVHSGLDARGYHRVDSVMVELALVNEVRLEPADGLQVSYDPVLPFDAERTTVYRAAAALAGEFGFAPRVRIHVVRRIPVQAGLGGASSDAAAVLRALCEREGIDPRGERVQAVARVIGADVPFFLYGGVAYLAGGGDELKERFEPNPLSGVPVVLVRADGPGVPTPAAYAEFDRTHPPAAPLEPLLCALRAGDADGAIAHMANNLEPVACALDCECAEVRERLSAQAGVRAAMVSGSGSAVLGICESARAAELVAASARGRSCWAEATAIG